MVQKCFRSALSSVSPQFHQTPDHPTLGGNNAASERLRGCTAGERSRSFQRCRLSSRTACSRRMSVALACLFVCLFICWFLICLWRCTEGWRSPCRGSTLPSSSRPSERVSRMACPRSGRFAPRHLPFLALQVAAVTPRRPGAGLAQVKPRKRKMSVRAPVGRRDYPVRVLVCRELPEGVRRTPSTGNNPSRGMRQCGLTHTTTPRIRL